MKIVKKQLTNKVEKKPLIWCYLYIIALLTYGFVKNFLSLNLVSDIFGAVFVLSVINARKNCLNIKDSFFKLVICFIFCCILVALMGMYSIRLSVLGIRNYTFFIIFGLFFSNFRQEKTFEKVLTFIARVGTAVCFFAILQFLFQNIWPEELLRYHGTGFEGVFGFTDQPLLRVNGLLENTIVFGNFSMVISLIWFGKLMVYRKNFSDILCFGIVLISVLLSVGRVSIFGTLLGLIIVYFFCSKKKRSKKIFNIAAFLLLLLVLVLIFFGDSVILKRILGGGESTSTSNEIHLDKAKDGLTALSNNWLLGIGIGTQGYNRGDLVPLVEDGGFISFALELGIPTMILFIFLLVYMLVFALKNINKRSSKAQLWCTSVLVASTLLIMMSCIFNSSFLARANYGTYWILVGVSFGLNKISNRSLKKACRSGEYNKSLQKQLKKGIMGNVDLSVIIVSYNNLKVIKDCLDSIYDKNDIAQRLQAIVVEQSPSDEIFDHIKSNYQWVDAVRAENRGFGAGNNIGASIAKGKYLLFLNPDTILVEHVFEYAISKFEKDAHLGLFGFRLLDANNNRTDSFDAIIPFGTVSKIRQKICIKLDMFLSKHMYIQGADLFMRKDLFEEIGRFDERFFMYCEEGDLSLRTRRAKYKVAYDNKKSIQHLQGACTAQKYVNVYRAQLNSYRMFCEKFGRSFKSDLKRELRYQKMKKKLMRLLHRNAEAVERTDNTISVILDYLSPN